MRVPTSTNIYSNFGVLNAREEDVARLVRQLAGRCARDERPFEHSNHPTNGRLGKRAGASELKNAVGRHLPLLLHPVSLGRISCALPTYKVKGFVNKRYGQGWIEVV